jgi:hypothetical protein
MSLHKLTRTILTLQKRASTLRALLNKNASEYQLLKAAGRVRDARIQVLRATIGDIPSVLKTPAQSRRIAKLDIQIAALRSTAPMTVVAEFRLAQEAASEEC